MESYERHMAARWTARQKLALVLQVLQDRLPVHEAADLQAVLVNDIDDWTLDARAILETATIFYPDLIVDLYNDHIAFLEREYIDAVQKRDFFTVRLKEKIRKRLME